MRSPPRAIAATICSLTQTPSVRNRVDGKAQAGLRGTQSSARRAPLGQGLPLTQPQLVSLPVKGPSPSILPGD